MKKVSCVVFFVSLVLFNCTNQVNTFKHDITEGPTPWTSEPANKKDADFSFAIVSDLYSGEREGVFAVAVEQLNLLRPQFVLSIGDLIEGGTEDTVALDTEFETFNSKISKLKAPFFYVGGNHDLTNPVMRKFWEKRFGRRYYHFLYNDVLFLMMDSEDYNETRMKEIYKARAELIKVLDGPNPEMAREMEYYKMPERKFGEISSEQSAYFENIIKQNPDVRWTFILMHKPVWQRENDGNLSRVEAALGDRNFTVINGHLHSYSHTTRNNHDYMILGTTSGGQNPTDSMAFDHVTLIHMNEVGPGIVNLRLEGILDKKGKIPLDGEKYCFQASACSPSR